MVSNPIDGTYLESRYLLHDGIKVAIEQSWGGKHEENVVANPMQETISVLLDNGIAIDGVYSSSDSVFVGVAIVCLFSYSLADTATPCPTKSATEDI